MIKEYKTPMLHIVSINKSDIVTASPGLTTTEFQEGDAILAPGRRFDEWNEGY